MNKCILSLLGAAVLACPSLHAQNSQAGFLTPDERTHYQIASHAAFRADPALKSQYYTLQHKLLKDYESGAPHPDDVAAYEAVLEKMYVAMIKLDPTVAPVIEKSKKFDYREAETRGHVPHSPAP